MKLLRYGTPGAGKARASRFNRRDPRSVRRRAGHRGRPLLPGLRSRKLRQVDPASLPARERHAAHRSVRRPRRQVHLHRLELLGSRGRVGHGGAERADRLHEGHVLHRRTERQRRDAARIAEDGLGSRARRRHRQDREVRRPSRTRCRTSPATASSTTCPSGRTSSKGRASG